MAIPTHEVAPGSNHFAPEQTHPTIQTIAKTLRWFSPQFSPKDVPRFYDLSGITENPPAFKAMIDVFVERYKAAGAAGPTVIVGYDARGFVIGPPIAMALGIPFVLLRKAGKNPGVVVESEPFHKEYAEAAPDTMCIRVGSVKPGDRVVLIDDLIATGGTAISGFELIAGIGATVYEFAAMIVLPVCKGIDKIRQYQGGKFATVPVFTVVEDATIGDDMGRDPTGWPADQSRVVGFAEAEALRQKFSLQ
mmetsp:Transcript_28909/g.62432  ORF Transcript_28909/g.62432 Transcript_28909/m.62432 type:complete len:249 (-) Transcript_28909:25-771(-)